MSTITVPRHIYWSCREQPSVELDDPRQMNWLLVQTLVDGTMSDIRALDLEDVKRALPALRLPQHVSALWRDYFARSDPHAVPQEDS